MGRNYLAIVLVLLAIVLVADPLPDLFKVLRATWLMSTVLTLALLGAIPLLGSQVTFESDTSPVGMRAYNGAGTIMGMTSSRNTGFARYAAISALVALPGLMRKGKLVVRIIWGILFAVSIYALVIANGRTETLAFIGGAVVILGAEKAKRTAYFLVGIGAAILLGLRGFYSAFFLWFTRTGQLDLTMTGRTTAWEEGWTYLAGSPWVGLGFQSDRYFLHTHMHNAFLHVLFQAGFLGGGGILIGYAIVSYYVVKYFFLRKPADKSLIPPEIPAIFLFVTISSITESTFAYFSATWLMGAPIVAYVMALHQHMRAISAKAAQDRAVRLQLARRAFRKARSPEGGAAAPPLGSGGAGMPFNSLPFLYVFTLRHTRYFPYRAPCTGGVLSVPGKKSVTQDAPKRPESVFPSNFLPLGVRAPVIGNRRFIHVQSRRAILIVISCSKPKRSSLRSRARTTSLRSAL